MDSAIADLMSGSIETCTDWPCVYLSSTSCQLVPWEWCLQLNQVQVVCLWQNIELVMCHQQIGYFCHSHAYLDCAVWVCNNELLACVCTCVFITMKSPVYCMHCSTVNIYNCYYMVLYDTDFNEGVTTQSLKHLFIYCLICHKARVAPKGIACSRVLPKHMYIK